MTSHHCINKRCKKICKLINENGEKNLKKKAKSFFSSVSWIHNHSFYLRYLFIENNRLKLLENRNYLLSLAALMSGGGTETGPLKKEFIRQLIIFRVVKLEQSVFPDVHINLCELTAVSSYLPHLKGLPDLLKFPPPHSSNCLGDSLRWRWSNFVRNSSNGQIWSVKYELLRFAVKSYLLPLTVSNC